MTKTQTPITCTYIFLFFVVYISVCSFFFFFQAEDGIRDGRVTGVQTCALPIYIRLSLVVVRSFDKVAWLQRNSGGITSAGRGSFAAPRRRVNQIASGCREARLEIGRASCRERV